MQFCIHGIYLHLFARDTFERSKMWLVIISGLFSCLTLIETCLACHIEHLNLVCNVYLSHGDKLYFTSNIFYS